MEIFETISREYGDELLYAAISFQGTVKEQYRRLALQPECRPDEILFRRLAQPARRTIPHDLDPSGPISTPEFLGQAGVDRDHGAATLDESCFMGTKETANDPRQTGRTTGFEEQFVAVVDDRNSSRNVRSDGMKTSQIVRMPDVDLPDRRRSLASPLGQRPLEPPEPDATSQGDADARGPDSQKGTGRAYRCGGAGRLWRPRLERSPRVGIWSHPTPQDRRS